MTQSMLTVLYVEDNPENRMLIRRVLMAEGYHVIEADSGQEALQVVERTTPDLILVDMNMPDLDGYTLTGMFKKRPRLRHIPVVALTANVMKGDRERTLAAGCDGYIEKPIDVDTFPWKIAQYLIGTHETR